jgi:integrase
MKLHKKLHKLGASMVTKNSRAYWHERVYRPVIDGAEVTNYCVQMSSGGVRRSLSLRTPNREAAAQTARDWFVFLSANGWAAFDAKYRAAGPSATSLSGHPRGDDNTVLTVGAFLSAVRGESDLHRQTLADYERAFRTLVGGILAMGSRGKARGRTNQQKWRESVDSVPLAALTADRIQKWRKAYVERAQDDELLRRRYVTTTNSYIRRSKALFSKRVLSKLRSIKLPEPLPFDGVESGGRPDNRFYGISGGAAIDDLISDAVVELDTEVLKAFVLAAGLGLRRREIDVVEWSWVDFSNGTLTIRPTADYRLKSHASASVLPLEQEILTLMRGWRASAKGRFIVESESSSAARHPYRCEGVFQTLITWLRQKGVDDLKPVHVLRKAFGSRIAQSHGIFEASKMLRHRDVGTTTASYLDTRPRVTAGIGPMLSGKQVPMAALKSDSE